MSASRTGVENYKSFLMRLKELFTHYCDSKSINNFTELVDDCVLITFLDSLNPSTREFVLASKPKTSVEAAEMSDLHYEIQRQCRHDSAHHNRHKNCALTKTAENYSETLFKVIHEIYFQIVENRGSKVNLGLPKSGLVKLYVLVVNRKGINEMSALTRKNKN